GAQVSKVPLSRDFKRGKGHHSFTSRGGTRRGWSGGRGCGGGSSRTRGGAGHRRCGCSLRRCRHRGGGNGSARGSSGGGRGNAAFLGELAPERRVFLLQLADLLRRERLAP